MNKIIEGIIQREGVEYTNDPRDSGGPTKFGITQRTMSKFLGRQCSASEVEQMSRATAAAIYERMYIQGPGFDKVLNLSERIGNELIDTGVNMGPARATMFLQHALNGLNRNGKDYPDIGEDGDCGPGTVSALRRFLLLRKSEGETVLLAVLNGLQTAYYVDLANRRPKDEAFLYGWIRARVCG